jgi:signal transduction histidine kinase
MWSGLAPTCPRHPGGIIDAVTEATGRRRPSSAVVAAVTWLVTPAALAGVALLNWRIAAAGRADLAGLRNGDLVFLSAALTASSVGALVAARRPRHPVGWLFAALGAAIAVTGLADTYALYGVLARPGAMPWAAEAAILGDAAFVPWLVLVALVLYLTPTGRPLSPVWGRLAAGTVLAGGATFGLKLVQDSDLDPPMSGLANPWALTRLAAAVDAVEAAAVLAAGIGLILGGVSLLVRFRRAAGVQRQQLMWLALAAVPLPVFVAAAFAGASTGHPLVVILATGGFIVLIPVAVGLAVVQYRLYDIDRIVSRATAYLILSALVAAVYAMIVVVSARTLGTVAGRSPLVVSVATLVAIGVAAPVRRAVQDGVDRRFNRRRFDTLRMVRQHVQDPQPSLGIEELLRRALGDPTLQLSYWVEDRAQWVHAEGQPVHPTADAIDVSRHGRPIARLDFDPQRVERDLAQAAAAAAVPELDNVGLRAAIALQLVEVRQSRARIAAAQAQERRRIERNLHDGAQQRLLALGFQLQAAQLNGSPERLRAAISAGVAELRTAMAELRKLANGLHPALLSDDGLAAALDDLAARVPVPIDVRADDLHLAPDTEVTAWFIACEAITNTVKHASAAHITIDAYQQNGELLLTVTDDGTGGANPAGHGLRGLADRAEAAGGSLTVSSPIGVGTTITLELPCAS